MFQRVLNTPLLLFEPKRDNLKQQELKQHEHQQNNTPVESLLQKITFS